MKKLLIYLLAVSISLSTFNYLPKVSADGQCTDLQFVFARGSGAQREKSLEWQSFRQSVYTAMQDISLTYQLTDLNYPASSVNDTLTQLSVFASAGNAGDFARSVQIGATNLFKYYQQINTMCPATRWVFFGYSQGAKVLDIALGAISSEKVLYVATFGDPNLYLPEGEGISPPACRGENFSPYRAYVPDCNTDDGIFGARKPYVRSGYTNKTGAWCNDHDLICGSSKNLFINSGHSEYAQSTGIPNAVNHAIQKIQATYQKQNTSTPASPITPTAQKNVAIFFDTNGIRQANLADFKAEALRVAELTFSGGGKVALYDYQTLTIKHYPRQLCDFTCTLDEFEARLNTLHIDDSYSSDWLDSYLSAIITIMNHLDWQPEAAKPIISMSIPRFLSIDQIVKNQLTQSTIELGIKLDFITLHDGIDYFTKIAKLANGAAYDIGEYQPNQITRLATAQLLNATISPKQSITNTLTAPTNLKLAYAADYTAELSWQPDPETAYTLITANNTILGYLPSNLTSIIITDLNSYVDYDFALTSLDAQFNIGTTTILHIPKTKSSSFVNSALKAPNTGYKPETKNG